jgi:hypothetical protein
LPLQEDSAACELSALSRGQGDCRSSLATSLGVEPAKERRGTRRVGVKCKSCHRTLEHEEARAVEVGIGKMFMVNVEKVSAIRVECNSRNGPSSEKLSLCFRTSAVLAPTRFNDMLLEESQRLRCSEKSVDGLEREFCSFKAAVHSESTLSDSLKTHGATIGFADAWQPLGTSLPRHGSSAAGLPRSSLAPLRWSPTLAH